MISYFHGHNEFLSNFYESPIEVERVFKEINGKKFQTVEHAFQAAKTKDLAEIFQIMNLKTPGQAKRFGAKVQLRKDWEKKKNFVMGQLLVSKFEQNPELMEKLKETKGEALIEGNGWHDNYWGVCSCEACRSTSAPQYNYLGQLLMAIRDETTSKFLELTKCLKQ